MDSPPLVSVIIIFLNAEKFLQEAIESVFSQTYQHWELILIDDGSDDASTEIAKQYALKNSERVQYFEHPHHQNRGMSASRNLGIRHARGEFLTFVDADDVWLPQKLEQQVPILNAIPEAAMLYSNTLYWYSWTGNPEDKQRDFTPELGITPDRLYDPPALLPLFLNGKAAIPCICSILVRRKAVDHIDGFEESFINMYEDQAFYAKIILEMPVYVARGCWEMYRQHPDATCINIKTTGRLQSTQLCYLNWLKSYLLKKRIENIQIWQALRKAHWQTRHPALARFFRKGRRLAWLWRRQPF
jgi:glycosyltransferase involved in cell wall biosynthesis